MPPTQEEWNAWSFAGTARKYGIKFKQKGRQPREGISEFKVIMTERQTEKRSLYTAAHFTVSNIGRANNQIL